MPARPAVRAAALVVVPIALALTVVGAATYRLGRDAGERRTLACTDQCQRIGYRWGYVDPVRPEACDCRPERVSQLADWLDGQGTWP